MPLIYSTGTGRICPSCEMPLENCVCKKKKTPTASGDGVVRVRRELKGRKGKTVTTITGLPFSDSEMQKSATEFKRKCGAGGSVKDGVILIQGDHCDVLIEELRKKGFNTKRAGG